MTWIDEELEKFATAHDLRNTLKTELKRHARGKLAILADEGKQSAFIEAALLAIHMMSDNRKSLSRNSGTHGAMQSKLERIRASAKSLADAISSFKSEELCEGPSEIETFEGKIGGSGLLSVTKEACARIIERADKVAAMYATPRGGQRRNEDIMGILTLAKAWQEFFGAKPSAKGAFGSFINATLEAMGWEEVAPNTLSAWLRYSQ